MGESASAALLLALGSWRLALCSHVIKFAPSMNIALDGIPLTLSKTGVGHYTFELARSLAALNPTDQIKLLAPSSLTAMELDSNLPSNLYSESIPVGQFSRHWWTIGLSAYLRRES